MCKKTRKSSATERRHKLRDAAGRIMGEYHRVSRCGRHRTASTVGLNRHADGRCCFTGLETCGSIWACPECAGKIANRRAVEVGELAEAHEAKGGAVYMATLTTRHKDWQRCKDLRLSVTQAWSRLIRGKPWQKIRDQYAVMGYVRALEVTHGKSGWHPHLHVLIFTGIPLDATEEFELGARLFGRWATMIEKEGGDADIKAFDFKRAGSATKAAEYVAKWGCGSEISKGSAKAAMGGNRSPWELLAAFDKGDKAAGNLYSEFVTAMFGARHLTYAQGLRELYGLRAPATDEELAEAEQDELGVDEHYVEEIYRFDQGTWHSVVCRKLTGRVLAAAREGGWEAVETLLQDHGLTSYEKPDKPGYLDPHRQPFQKQRMSCGEITDAPKRARTLADL